MKICKRGNISNRDKWGHCLCNDCIAYRKEKYKPHTKEYQKNWRKNNPEKVKAYITKWNLLHKEQRDNIIKSWRQRHPDKVKEMSSRGGKKWMKNNRGKRNASVKARQMALIQRIPTWANLKEMEKFYLEAERLTKETGIPHEVDHIIPLQGELVSGLHIESNLQVITRFQNRSKKNKFKSDLCEC